MKTNSTFLQYFAIIASLVLLTYSADAVCQAGINGGKPIVTFDYTDPAPIKAQSPPSFPGGEHKLKEFILKSIRETKNPIKLNRKTWLTASINKEGKLVNLVPTYDSDPSLKREIKRIGDLMPKWKPGLVNNQGVDTQFQFLLRR